MQRPAGITLVTIVLLAIATAAQTPQPPAPSPAGPGRGRGAGQGTPAPSRGGGGGGGTAGPADKPIVDPVAVTRGQQVWIAECISCHGAQARGTETGPNLLRSVLMLRDRYGNDLGPFLKKSHPLQSGKSASSLTDAQVGDLSQFIRKQLNDSLRGSDLFTVQNIRTGDAVAGAEYFNGAGKCGTCHSPTGDLAGLSGRYETVDIQQRMLFPGGGRGGRGGRRGAPPPASAVRVTVTPQGGAAVSGVLLYMDDFVVSLQDSTGGYRSFKRTPGLKIDKTDPLDAHHALLDTISDKNIHDLVAYLETLR